MYVAKQRKHKLVVICKQINTVLVEFVESWGPFMSIFTDEAGSVSDPGVWWFMFVPVQCVYSGHANVGHKSIQYTAPSF